MGEAKKKGLSPHVLEGFDARALGVVGQGDDVVSNDVGALVGGLDEGGEFAEGGVGEASAVAEGVDSEREELNTFAQLSEFFGEFGVFVLSLSPLVSVHRLDFVFRAGVAIDAKPAADCSLEPVFRVFREVTVLHWFFVVVDVSDAHFFLSGAVLFCSRSHLGEVAFPPDHRSAAPCSFPDNGALLFCTLLRTVGGEAAGREHRIVVEEKSRSERERNRTAREKNERPIQAFTAMKNQCRMVSEWSGTRVQGCNPERGRVAQARNTKSRRWTRESCGAARIRQTDRRTEKAGC